MRFEYPFSALVGQEMLRIALILNAVDPRVGGVLIRGERGTAKSTAARALAALLPSISVVAGCRFGCDPDVPAAFCSECQQRIRAGEDPLPVESRPVPFVNLPISATEDRVVGTLDIERAIQKGQRVFEPGVLAAANRGLLYVDEVNLLDDHVVDVLLDSAAMGVSIVERESISFSHPARFILVGTMNPDEGDLRPQLTDRFGLSVDVHSISDLNQRVQIIQRCLAFERCPEEFCSQWQPKEQELAGKIRQARELVNRVSFSEETLREIAQLTTAMKVDGHRADLGILKTARAYAAYEGRMRITKLDVAKAGALVLPHRIKRSVHASKQMSPDELRNTICEALNLPARPTVAALAEKAHEQLASLVEENALDSGPWKHFRTGLG